MNTNSPKPTRWCELIDQHLLGTISKDEAIELEAALASTKEAREDFRQRCNVDAALRQEAVQRAGAPAVKVSRPERWYAWRPLTAAAAGIAFGMFCSSVVYGFVLTRAAVKRTPLPVFDPGFEGTKPLDTGLPHSADEWGVRSARIVPAENGVRPLQGQHMLRMEPVSVSEQDKNHYSIASQILDLRSLPLDAVSGTMEAQIAASFCAAGSAVKEPCMIRVVALNEPPETATEDFWSKAENAGVVSLTQRFETRAGDSGWHTFAVKMPLPQGAQSLVIILSATSPKNKPTQAAVRYLDDLQVSVLTSQTHQP